MKQLLKIRNLSYRKNQRLILKKVNLTLGPGKIVALLGANGAGKTTLMRIIAGVAKNYRGQVQIAGAKLEAGRKAKVVLTDRLRELSPHCQIKNVVALEKALFNDFDQEVFRQLQEFMQLKSEMRLGQLSRGMREKLVIALTFARKGNLYLLDEPFNGVDAMARKKIINSMLLWKPKKATVLISDHFVNEISSLLDEVVLLKEQTILVHKGADDIRAKHESIEQYYESFYREEEE